MRRVDDCLTIENYYRARRSEALSGRESLWLLWTGGRLPPLRYAGGSCCPAAHSISMQRRSPLSRLALTALPEGEPFGCCGCKTSRKGTVRRLCDGFLPLKAEIRRNPEQPEPPWVAAATTTRKGAEGVRGKTNLCFPPAALRRFRRAKAALNFQ